MASLSLETNKKSDTEESPPALQIQSPNSNEKEICFQNIAQFPSIPSHEETKQKPEGQVASQSSQIESEKEPPLQIENCVNIDSTNKEKTNEINNQTEGVSENNEDDVSKEKIDFQEIKKDIKNEDNSRQNTHGTNTDKLQTIDLNQEHNDNQKDLVERNDCSEESETRRKERESTAFVYDMELQDFLLRQFDAHIYDGNVSF
jgi:hypothetical protein